uniref:Bm9615 n=1 Tax=Brugia malayi TaxID=6279 RepID=A0A1I9G1H4_BRUMA|nr:Bm9615 [Brugia malayi]
MPDILVAQHSTSEIECMFIMCFASRSADCGIRRIDVQERHLACCSSYFVENKLGCHAVAGVNQTSSEKHRISVTSVSTTKRICLR